MPPNPAFLNAESRLFARYALDPQTRELQLDKPRLTVRAVEMGTGEPALFLHGFGLTTAHWAPLLARLPSLHRVAIDMPGHGASDGVDYRGVNLREWYKDMLTDVLDKLGVESAHIIGHSQGAMLGMWLALDAPERVRSLVAIGTPAVAFGARLDSLKFLTRPGIGSLMLSMPKPTAMYRSILAQQIGLHAIESAPDLVRVTYLANRRAEHGKTISTYLREMFRGAAAEPRRYVLSEEELAQIHQPVLIVWGEGDDQFQPIAEAKKKASLMLSARFQVVPGGHEPWLDDLEACAQPISSFLLH